MIDRDRLNSTNRERAAQSALRMLDHVSDHEPELQPVALAMAIHAFASRAGHDIGHLLTVAQNILRSPRSVHSRALGAIQLYMEHEIPAK